MLAKWIVPILLLNASAGVSAQNPTSSLKPTSPPAIAVRSAEITTALRFNASLPVADTALRWVRIGSTYNVGISVVRRSQVHGKTPADAIVHDAITEVYQIIEGRGVLVTGGIIESPSTLPADDPDVLRLIGPTSIGKRILSGTRQEVGPGDVIVIPPHTPHGFAEIRTKRIVYTLIRIDSERVIELRDQQR